MVLQCETMPSQGATCASTECELPGGVGISGDKLSLENIGQQLLKPNSFTCNCASGRACHHTPFDAKPRSVGPD